MKLPRFRLKLWMLVVAVAVAAFAFGMITRRARFLALPEYHESHSDLITFDTFNKQWHDWKLRPTPFKRDIWHGQVAEKYHRAARRPFLPVAPDPPMPA